MSTTLNKLIYTHDIFKSEVQSLNKTKIKYRVSFFTDDIHLTSINIYSILSYKDDIYYLENPKNDIQIETEKNIAEPYSIFISKTLFDIYNKNILFNVDINIYKKVHNASNKRLFGYAKIYMDNTSNINIITDYKESEYNEFI